MCLPPCPGSHQLPLLKANHLPWVPVSCHQLTLLLPSLLGLARRLLLGGPVKQRQQQPAAHSPLPWAQAKPLPPPHQPLGQATCLPLAAPSRRPAQLSLSALVQLACSKLSAQLQRLHQSLQHCFHSPLHPQQPLARTLEALLHLVSLPLVLVPLPLALVNLPLGQVSLPLGPTHLPLAPACPPLGPAGPPLGHPCLLPVLGPLPQHPCSPLVQASQPPQA